MLNLAENEITLKLDNLKTICDLPRLYLANYFADLRTQVDLCFAQSSGEDSKEVWQKMIEKIESFENECLKKVTETDFSDTNNRLNELEAQLTIKNYLKEQLDQLELEEYKILSKLFSGQTIFFLDSNKHKTIFFATPKLVIIQNEYITRPGLDYIRN